MVTILTRKVGCCVWKPALKVFRQNTIFPEIEFHHQFQKPKKKVSSGPESMPEEISRLKVFNITFQLRQHIQKTRVVPTMDEWFYYHKPLFQYLSTSSGKQQVSLHCRGRENDSDRKTTSRNANNKPARTSPEEGKFSSTPDPSPPTPRRQLVVTRPNRPQTETV